ncbi:MAG: DUF63 family protein [archaeon]|jgi:uncharacterized membrane protein
MEHILQYFVGNGYNLINTTVYAVIVFFSYFFFYKILKKYFPEVKIDKYFICSVLAFVLLGASLRILEQNYTSVWLVKSSWTPLELGFYFHTPGWLVLLSVVFLCSFFFSLWLDKLTKIKYYTFLQGIGLLLSLPLLVYELFHTQHLFVLVCTLSVIILIFFLVQFIANKLNGEILKSLENKLVILSQIVDFSATLSGIFFFGNLLYEQHPVSRAVIGSFPVFYPLVKLVFAFLFIWIVDKTIKDEEERSYTKLLIIILGFLTGLRDILTIALLL